MELTTKTSDDSFIPTHATLLNRIKNLQDKESWQAFYTIYKRMVLRIARKSGLDEHAAEEILQDTMLTVAQSIDHYEYEPKSCSFKSWLLLLTRCRIVDYYRKKQRRIPSVSSAAVSDGSDGEDVEKDDPTASLPDAVWEIEWQKGLMDAAMEKIRAVVSAQQFQIFDFYVIKEWPATKVAKALNVNIAQVYLGKYRVTALLKKEIAQLKAKWE